MKVETHLEKNETKAERFFPFNSLKMKNCQSPYLFSSTKFAQFMTPWRNTQFNLFSEFGWFLIASSAMEMLQLRSFFFSFLLFFFC